jgi:ATP-binding cassette subfamily B protein
MENIRYGRLDATDEDVVRAAGLVSADAVVARLPKGFDTEVGEGGDRLSTGEKQLISFARLFWPTRRSLCSTRPRLPSTPRRSS